MAPTKIKMCILFTAFLSLWLPPFTFNISFLTLSMWIGYAGSVCLCLRTSWGWWFIAKTCREVHVHGQFMVLYKLCASCQCICMIIIAMHGTNNIKQIFLSTPVLAPQNYIHPMGWEMKFHIHTKQKVKL